MAAGGNHSLALKSDGTVLAWGYNESGQSTVPAGLSGVVAIAGGGDHSLALKSDGTVVAWGATGSAQSTVPAGLSGVVAIAGGEYHSLALFRQPLPALQMQFSGNSLLLSWPANYSTAILESARSLESSANWTPVPGSDHPRTIPIGSGSEFFRLRIP
jgi:hypothetical protein